MAYIGKNPKFDGVILDDQVTDSVTAPKSGSYKLINRNGSLFNVNSSGVESAVGTAAAGEINYIDEWDAETAVVDWATYADAAGTTPVDGTGGTANITWTRQSSTILRGTQSYKLTKDAANRQGEGASYDFTIKTQDTNKKLKIQFDFKTDEDAAFAQGDLTVYVYDVTNSTLITPVDVDITKGQNIFQTSFNSTDSTSYRLIFHVATTNASAWDVYIDNIIVGPGMTSQGAAIGKWISTTLTFSGNTGTRSSEEVWYRRVGDTMEVRGRLEFSGAGSNGSSMTFDIPEGLTFNTDVVPTGPTSSQFYILGYGGWSDSGTSFKSLGLAHNDTTDQIAFAVSTADTTGFLAANAIASGDDINFFCSIPISEWAGKGIVPMLAEDNLSEWTEFTDNVSVLTTNIQDAGGRYRRVGDSMECYFGIEFSGTNTDGEWRINASGLPGGYNVDTSKLDGITFTGGPDEFPVGTWYIRDAGGTRYEGTVVVEASSGNILCCEDGASTFVQNGTPLTWADGDIISVNFTVPVTEFAGSQNSLVGYSEATPTNLGLSKAEKQYVHGTDFTLSSDAAATVAIVRAVAVPYQTYDGAWRMKFNLALTHGADGSFSVTFSGVTFKNVSNYLQSCSVANKDGDVKTAANTGNLTVNYSTTPSSTRISGDVELESKPTWAD